MRKSLVAAIVGVGLLAGCVGGPEAYIQSIEDDIQEYGRIVSEGEVISTADQGNDTSIMIVKHPRGTYECTLWRQHRTCKLL